MIEPQNLAKIYLCAAQRGGGIFANGGVYISASHGYTMNWKTEKWYNTWKLATVHWTIDFTATHATPLDSRRDVIPLGPGVFLLDSFRITSTNGDLERMAHDVILLNLFDHEWK